MEMKISAKVSIILEYAREEAARTGHYAICIDHLTLGIIRDSVNEAVSAMAALGIDVLEMKSGIESGIMCENSIPFDRLGEIGVSRGVHSVMNMAGLEMLREGAEEIEVRHLMAAIARTSGNLTKSFLERENACGENLTAKLRQAKPDTTPARRPQKAKPAPVTQVISIRSGKSKIFS